MSYPAAYDLPFPIHKFNPSVPLQDKKWSDANPNSNKLWPRNKRFRIAFLNGTANQKAKVKKYAQEWVRVIGAVQFDFVNGIHGDVRIAFSDPKPKSDVEAKKAELNDDPIQEVSWSQVGTDCIGRSYLPETTHLNEITDTDPNVKPTTEDEKKTVRYERIIVEHVFGHILGFQFAPNSTVELGKKSLQDWRASITPDNWGVLVERQKANIKKYLKDSYGLENIDWTKLVRDPKSSLATFLANLPKKESLPSIDASQVWAENQAEPILQPGLTPDSVMVFDWRNRISANDARVMAQLYPFPVRAITFGIQDAFDRSLKGLKDDDLVLYAISVDNYIYRNTRYIWKDTATSPAESTWKGWEKLVAVPPYARTFVALDFPDRLEFFVATNSKDDPLADDSLLLRHNALKKDANTWVGWDTVRHVNDDLKLFHTKYGRTASLRMEPATVLRAIEVDGGANVFFITSNRVLGTITRKAGELEVPKTYHPVSNASDVIAITSARIGAPTITNPPRIVAVTEPSYKFDISISAPNKTTQNWSLSSEGTAHEPGLYMRRLATGMATDTQHIIGICDKGKLHQNLNKDGWLSWDDKYNELEADADPKKRMPKEADGSPAKFISISVGVIASNDQEDGYLRTFAVSTKGKLYVATVDDEGNWTWKDIGIPEDKIPKDIKRVTAKRTRSGDLVVFVISSEENKQRKEFFDVLSSITYDHQGLSKASQQFGFQKVWWDPRALEVLESKSK